MAQLQKAQNISINKMINLEETRYNKRIILKDQETKKQLQSYVFGTGDNPLKEVHDLYLHQDKKLEEELEKIIESAKTQNV